MSTPSTDDGRADRPPDAALAAAADEHFPGSNPHPVMRVLDDGTLTYANQASEAVLAALGVRVGDCLRPVWRERLAAAAADARPVELAVGARTFELLAVRVGGLGFTNVYGTDVTAARLVDKFPDLNPSPVLRISEAGEIRYANEASAELRHSLGAEIGDPLPEELSKRVFAYLDGVVEPPIEVTDPHGTHVLRAVRIPEIGLINLYGTDVTASKALVKFPDENPNPVFRLDWDATIVYANPASARLLDGLAGAVGATLAEPHGTALLAAARNDVREVVEVASRERRYALLAVDVPEFGFINVYGTDVTASRELEMLYRQNRQLLLNVLPAPIAERLGRGERLIADRFEDVSLLFADIVDFTRMSSGMSAEELVWVLNELFSVFDRLVDEAGLEKVKTIGDAYMIVGGMTEPRPDHLEQVARLALSLDAAVGRIEPAQRFGVRFRTGINCGPVVAGVIGTRKFIYDVWGDTVNVASRMESTGVAGRIQVTAAVEERLRDRFRFEPRGVIDVKGKGPMPTFYLLGEAW